MWHLVLIGREHNERKCEASASLWKIIAAASFIPTDDEQTFLSWLTCCVFYEGQENKKEAIKH
jgi:hypothetical protein